MDHLPALGGLNAYVQIAYLLVGIVLLAIGWFGLRFLFWLLYGSLVRTRVSMGVALVATVGAWLGWWPLWGSVAAGLLVAVPILAGVLGLERALSGGQCPDCEGSGEPPPLVGDVDDFDELIVCARCGGTGWVKR